MIKKYLSKIILMIICMVLAVPFIINYVYSEEIKIGGIPEENQYYLKEIDDKIIFIIRIDNKVYAIDTTCTYDGTKLNYDGALMQHMCDKCDSRYNAIGILLSGSVSNRSLNRYFIKIKNNEIYVDLNIIYREGDDDYDSAYAIVISQ